MRTKWSWPAVIGVIFLLGAALRLYDLGSKSLWLDESFTHLAVRLEWPEMFQLIRFDGVHPPLYYILEKLVTLPLPDDEGNLRLLSFIAGSMGILVAAWIGWWSGGKPGACYAAWFWAFHPMMIWYSQDARQYALLSLLSLLLVILFLRALRPVSPGLFTVAGVLMVIGFLTHYFFLLLAAACLLFLISEIRREPALFRRWALVTLLSMIPLSLWLGWFFLLDHPTVATGWIVPPAFIDPFLTLWNFLSGYGGEFSLSSTLFGAAAFFLVLIGLARGQQAGRNRRMLLYCIAAPIIFVFLVSYRRPIYVDRFLIVLAPFLIPPLAEGGEEIYRFLRTRSNKSWETFGLAAIFLFTGLFDAWQVHSSTLYARQDWKGLENQLASDPTPAGDFWFSFYELTIPFEYYHSAPYALISSPTPPACTTPCYWVLSQPYTATHAFTQTVTDSKRPWLPEIPATCYPINRWNDLTGIALWKIQCD